MHKFAKQIMECVKTKVEAMGIDNIEGQHLEELEKWTEIAKNIVCYDKDYKIVEAMDEAENNDEIMSRIEMYEDYPERRYYDNYRYKTSGRFAPKGKGSYMPRRCYEEPPYYHMNPDMYREHTPEYYRDMDRESGRLYFSEPIENTMNIGNMHDKKDGRSWKSRRGYMDSKELHKSNTPEDKQAKMRELENYAKELTEDITEMVSDMSAEEKNLIRSKIQTLAQKIQ